MNNLRIGDICKVSTNTGRPVEATFLGLSYAKEPKHYKVRVKTPKAKGYRMVTWYLPESRFQ